MTKLFMMNVSRNKAEFLSDKLSIQLSIRQFKCQFVNSNLLNMLSSFDTRIAMMHMFMKHVFRDKAELLNNKLSIQMLNRQFKFNS